MKLYVVRHGETPSNISGIVSGRSSESLTEEGIKQSQIINQKLADLKFTAVYVSPMKRTIETAEIIVPEYKYIIDDRIAERDLGDLQNYTIDELWKMPLWNSLTELRTPEGAETFASGLERTRDFLFSLKSKYRQPSKNPANEPQILLITHSFISRCIWSIVNDITDEETFKTFSHKNDEIKIYNI